MRDASTWDRFPGACDAPSRSIGRQSVRPSVVERGGHGLFDQFVQGAGFDLVAPVGIGDAVGGRDGPAVLAVEPLVPPAVEHAQIQGAVKRGLHAGRAHASSGRSGLLSHTSQPGYSTSAIPMS